MRARTVLALLPTLTLGLLLSSSAMAQQNGGDDGGECAGGLCGTPDQSGGGGCGCGGGSILINNTDIGDTYQYSDDYDSDGFEDDFDNCPFVSNAQQIDTDGDGVGDACDNCQGASNDQQIDTDSDGMGNACDIDMDNDGVDNNADLCVDVSNPAQLDSDNDGMGNACDNDDDNDGVLDGADNCPLVANPAQDDPSNYTGCRTDIDVDNVPDDVDNCLGLFNSDQLDQDGDGVGDVCDGDIDGDLISNLNDNCARIPNSSQLDADRDGIGEDCDDRFCYVIDQRDSSLCLDENLTFTVLSQPDDITQLGLDKRLHIFANRENAAMRYTWTIISKPENSNARIQHPRGSVTFSTSYEYHYLADQVARFKPDKAGDYELQLSAELIFSDEAFPNNNTSRTTFKLTAVEGEDNAGGCICAGEPEAELPAAWALMALGGVLVLTRRRRR